MTILKTFLRTLGASLAALCILAALSPASYAAATLVTRNGYIDNMKLIGFGDITGTPSFATTAYADVAGSNVTYTPSLNDCTTAARLGACLIRIDWSFDATKVTATTGVCAVFANGAVIANSARTVGAVTEDIIGGTYVVANTVVGPQTLKIQCKSGDTNALTVNFGHVVYTEIIPPYAR